MLFFVSLDCNNSNSFHGRERAEKWLYIGLLREDNANKLVISLICSVLLI
jgi:hypothetical protein